jgi:segregation and condensation protein B
VRDNLHRIIEAILFASDTPLSQQKFKEVLEGIGVKDIREAMAYLNQQYEQSGSALKIIEIAGGYQIVTREEYAPFLQKLYKGRSASRLTQRALETLAIVAYKQPITKQEIESIRGVNVDAVMKTLLERNLITIEGRQKAPGSPLLYGTTKYFLEYFGLKSLEALPKLKEIDELLKSDEKFLESLDQVAIEKLAPEVLGLKNPEELTMETDSKEKQAGQQLPLIVFEPEPMEKTAAQVAPDDTGDGIQEQPVQPVPQSGITAGEESHPMVTEGEDHIPAAISPAGDHATDADNLISESTPGEKQDTGEDVEKPSAGEDTSTDDEIK